MPERALYDPASTNFVAMTSGTTAHPLFIYRNLQRPAAFYEGVLFGGEAARLFIYIPTLPLSANLVTAASFFRETRALLLSPKQMDTAAEIATLYPPDAFWTTAEALFPLAQKLPEGVRSQVRRIVHAGLPLRPWLKTELAALFPFARIYTFYACAEVGGIGYQCNYLAKKPGGNYFHTNDTNVLVEIIPVDDEDVHEVVVTNSWRAPEPFIRYRTGDAGRWLQKPCPCGAAAAFELLGRTGSDLVKVGGLLVHAADIERALAVTAGSAIADFQALVGEVRVGAKTFIRLRLRLAAPKDRINLAQDRGLPGRLSCEIFVSIEKTWDDCVRLGRCLPLAVEFVDAIQRAGKPRRVIQDESGV